MGRSGTFGGGVGMILPERLVWCRGQSIADLRSREWMITNGLGGYAAGAIGDVATRRFHGVLVSAFPAPLGRIMVLNDLTEEATFNDVTFDVGSDDTLEECRFVLGLPIWTSSHRGVRIEKRIVMPHRQNTTYVSYRLLDAPGAVTLRLRPWIHVRPHEGVLSMQAPAGLSVRVLGELWEIEVGNNCVLRSRIVGNAVNAFIDGGRIREATYHVERERGYDWQEVLWSPGFQEVILQPGEEVTFIASTETWERIHALSPQEAHDAEHQRRTGLLHQADASLRAGPAAELVLSADQFLITPMRVGDIARARAIGEEAVTVIAGYPWFTDWGRDTMISLEGLTLLTGRVAETASILRTFAHYVRDGLVPNMFPEGGNDGLYHTADATLWFFHALHRYVLRTGDRDFLKQLLPTMEEIIRKHVEGTRFGIGVDPSDGLLTQGAPGYQLTWMDAKVGDWVVTPRRGKPVEINALYYNALCLVRDWLVEDGRATESGHYAEIATHVAASFNERFWRGNNETGTLYDVIDGPSGHDDACRPNQLLSFSLDHPVLHRERWKTVLETVREKLLTPVGLRSLSADHPDYKPRYDGDLRARDAAYHQGTVWAWLIGPFVDAHRRVYPTNGLGSSSLLDGLAQHLGEAGIGTISEIFDAEGPYLPRGCTAQAWSVAEALRVYALLALQSRSSPNGEESR